MSNIKDFEDAINSLKIDGLQLDIFHLENNKVEWVTGKIEKEKSVPILWKKDGICYMNHERCREYDLLLF